MGTERVGRAVLEITTEGGSFFKGIEDAKGRLRGLGATIKGINADTSRLAQGFSGRNVISEATKLTSVIQRLGGVEKLTAAERARANPILEEAAQKWRALGRPITDTSQRIEHYAAATRSASQATPQLTANVGQMAAVGVLAGNAIEGVLERVVRLGGESILTAARTQGLTAVAEYLGQRTGKSKDEIDALILSLNKQGITLQQSANLITQVSRANLGLENATKLAAVAQNAAFISGMSSSEALENIIMGIVTLQPRLLHTAGLMVSLEQGESRWAKQNGRTTESLSGEEKQMIALNEVLRAGEQINGTYALSMQYVGKQLTSLPRYVEDAESSVGEVFLPTLGVGVRIATELLKVIREYPKTFIAVTTALLAGGAAAAVMVGGFIAMSAGILAGAAAVVGIIGLLTNYIAKVTAGETAMKKFIAAGKLNEDQLSSSQKELLKLAGRMYDAKAAQEVVAAATGRTTDQLSEQEKKTIESSAKWNTWIDVLEEVWGRYKRLDFYTPVPITPQDIPTLPSAPDLSRLQPKAAMAAPTGLTVAARDMGLAQATLNAANAQYRKELAATSTVLTFYIRHMKELDLTEKEIAAQLQISESTVKRYKATLEALDKEDKKRPLAKFLEDLKQLSAQLSTATGTMTDAEFVKEFGNKIEDAERDIKRFGLTGTQIPADVTAAMLRLNRIDLAEWARKEAAELATVTDSVRGLGTAAAETAASIDEKVGAAINERVDIAKDAEKTQNAIANRRMEHEIAVAERSGASWQTMYALERRLREAQLRQAIQSSNEEFRLRSNAMDRTTQAGEDAYQDLVKAHAADVQQMVEDFNLGEQEKLDDLDRTHNIWRQTWKDMKTVAMDAEMAVADGLASILVGARSFHDAFLDIWRSVQRGIQSILAKILDYFIHSFLKGLIDGLKKSKLAEELGKLLGNVLGGGKQKGGNPFTNFAKDFLPGVLPGLLKQLPGNVPGVPGVPKPPPMIPPVAIGPIAGALVGAGVGYKTGSKTAGALSGGATGFGVGMMVGGPIGGLIGFGVGLLSGVIGGKLGAGPKANSNRDKFLAQFATFDTKRDDTNPPGFYGLHALLVKYKREPLFSRLTGAKNPKDVKAAEQPIAAFISTLGRQVKVFRLGTPALDFSNFGVRTSAELHGEEAVIPRGGGHRLAAEIAAALGQMAMLPAATHSGGRAELVLPLNGLCLGVKERGR